MDLCVIDVTDAPVTATAPGALVELLGATIAIDDLAARANTIGYEILTSLSSRYYRQYVGG
jgi:alanine racemase